MPSHSPTDTAKEAEAESASEAADVGIVMWTLLPVMLNTSFTRLRSSRRKNASIRFEKSHLSREEISIM